MSSATVTPNRARRAHTQPAEESFAAKAADLLEQTLERQRELMLQREYQVLGTIDFIWVVRESGLIKMDYRKSGPNLAFNSETGDFLLLTSWRGLPELAEPSQPCTACLGTCGDCHGKGKKPCTLTGCAGSGYLKVKFIPCPDCLGSKAGKTKPKCATCNGRGEVAEPEKCKGCDENGLAECAPCRGSGKVSTGKANGKTDAHDAKLQQFVTVPKCNKCSGTGRTAGTKPQDFRQFVNGRLENRVAIGPIQRIVWHTLGTGSMFQQCHIDPDNGGNLMVLLLDGEDPGAKQYLVGGIPQIK
jgi:hypothetical protein